MRLSLRATVPLAAALTAVLASSFTTWLGVLEARHNAWNDIDGIARQVLAQTADVLRVVPTDPAVLGAVVSTAGHAPQPTTIAVVADDGVVLARWPADARTSTWSSLVAAWPAGTPEALRAAATKTEMATSRDEARERVLGLQRASAALGLAQASAPVWIVAEVDVGPSLTSVYTTIARNWLAFVALMVTGGVVVGRVVHARIRNQTEALLAAARAIAKGDFAVRVGAIADDDFGTIATALDEMAAELNEKRLTTRQSEERYRVIFDEAEDAVVLFAHDGTLLDANAAATRLFGRSIDALRVTPFLDLVSPDDPLDVHGEAIRTRGASSGRGVVRAASGDVPVDFHGRTVGKVGILALFRDRRPALEAERLRLALVLQDRLAALGTLAAGIGHELNNPLAYVSGNLEVLERTLADVELDAAPDGRSSSTAAPRTTIGALLADARSGAARMRHIVAELNLFSRAQRTGGSGVVDVAVEVTAAADLARHGTKERARVDVDLEAALPRVVGEEGRLAQIILNLLTNAAHAMPAGRATNDNVVTVRARAEDDGAFVVIDVVDNGSGIDAAVLPRIFEPFFTTKGRSEGTGLGLSVSRELVLGMGGTIDVDSAPGRGTAFRVRLPARRAVAPAVASTAAASSVSLTGVRVLIVDDDALVARVLRLFLPDADVTVVDSVAAGLDAVANADVDVALCDLVMPDGGGRAFFDGLSRRAPALCARVVFMTAGITSDELDAFLRGAGRPVLDKPVDATTLRAQIAALVGAQAAAARA